MSVTIDISTEQVQAVLDIAADAPGGDMFTIRLGDVDICINWEQLNAIYSQVKPWFVEVEQ